MLQLLSSRIRRQFRDFLLSFYGIDIAEPAVEIPPRIEMGDLAFPFPFQLARQLRKAPKAIAEEVVANIGPIEGVARLEAAPPGFINLYLNRLEFLRELKASQARPEPPASGEKIIVEHTNINPNKAAHIGHLRNAILGDSFIRMLRNLGKRVEVQNYIDNTGVQVADVVVGFHFLRGMSLEQVEAIPEPFDYFCWDLYAEVSDWFNKEQERVRLRQEVLAAIETGTEPFFSLGEHIANRIVRAHLKTMDRIDVRYDVLPRESEILHLKFWEQAFQLLKERSAIYYAEDGPNRGCWVMNLPGEEGQPDEDKIIVRSNGTVTYVGKDIAYQLWKFGLLGRDFHYRPFSQYPDGAAVWVSALQPEGDTEPAFGAGRRVFNVIDVRQSYLQRVVVQGLRSLGYTEEADRSTHFSYEMVALSPRCCADLGIQLSAEDAARPYVEVSGRKGLGIKADDLIDKLIEKSAQEVALRQPNLGAESRDLIARQIAIGALRYFMLKYTRNSVIAFDFDEALSFEGETGPYLQYTVVRSNNIFRKLAERSGEPVQVWNSGLEHLWTSPVAREVLDDNETWGLVRDLARTREVVTQAVDSLEIAGTARHAFQLAQQFNLFYHSHHILSEEDEARRQTYLVIADAARVALVRVMQLLGIEVPERM